MEWFSWTSNEAHMFSSRCEETLFRWWLFLLSCLLMSGLSIKMLLEQENNYFPRWQWCLVVGGRDVPFLFDIPFPWAATQGFFCWKLIQAEKMRRRGRRAKYWRDRTFNTGIHKVLGQVHPLLEISRKAMAIMDSFAKDILDRIAKEASKICLYCHMLSALTSELGFLCEINHKKTLGSREIQSAVLLVLPADLAQLGVRDWQRACAAMDKGFQSGAKKPPPSVYQGSNSSWPGLQFSVSLVGVVIASLYSYFARFALG